MGRVPARGEGIPERRIGDIQTEKWERTQHLTRVKEVGGQEIDHGSAPYTSNNQNGNLQLRDFY